MSDPQTVEVETGAEPSASVIWLHGLGADGHDFEPIVPALAMPPELGVRFVFPHAPAIPVTINNGFVMPAWYDIRDLDLQNRADEAGVRASQERVHALIRRENARGIGCEDIVLAGFSQGGAVALHTGIRYPEKLAGIMALSTYLVCRDSIATERSEANRTTPIFQAHGTQDPMVPCENGEAARDRLVELGYSVAWHTYPMPHAVCPEEVAEIGSWLRARFGT